jgi:hypothetical protein
MLFLSRGDISGRGGSHLNRVGYLLREGLRFQWVQTKFVDDPVIGNASIKPDGWMSDYIYSVFVAVMYLF